MTTAVPLPGGPVPFIATRALFRQLPTEGELSLPSFLSHRHSDTHSSTHDRRDFKSQLRFRHAHSVITQLRPLAAELSESYPQGINITLCGELNSADTAAFTVIGTQLPLSITWTPTPTRDNVPTDPATAQVLTDHAWLKNTLSTSPDWPQFHSRIGRYLSCHDSWTAVWLIETALERSTDFPPEIFDLMGLAYQMAGQSPTSEVFRRRALVAGGLTAAQAYTSLAMLYARHHPPALRSLHHAKEFLNTGWHIVSALEKASLDQALNRNALAYVLMMQGRRAAALDLLSHALTLVAHDDLASAIIHNNLGRLYGTDFTDPSQELAEKHLRRAIALDPHFPEYHLDLAYQQARLGRYRTALTAATQAEKLAPDIPVIPAILGYVYSQLREPACAAAAYARAYQRDSNNIDYLIATVREACDASDPTTASQWLSCLDHQKLSPEQQAEVELLRLWAESSAQKYPPELTRQKLTALSRRFPQSELIQRNLQAQ